MMITGGDVLTFDIYPDLTDDLAVQDAVENLKNAVENNLMQFTLPNGEKVTADEDWFLTYNAAELGKNDPCKQTMNPYNSIYVGCFPCTCNFISSLPLHVLSSGILIFRSALICHDNSISFDLLPCICYFSPPIIYLLPLHLLS